MIDKKTHIKFSTDNDRTSWNEENRESLFDFQTVDQLTSDTMLLAKLGVVAENFSIMVLNEISYQAVYTFYEAPDLKLWFGHKRIDCKEINRETNGLDTWYSFGRTFLCDLPQSKRYVTDSPLEDVVSLATDHMANTTVGAFFEAFLRQDPYASNEPPELKEFEIELVHEDRLDSMCEDNKPLRGRKGVKGFTEEERYD